MNIFKKLYGDFLNDWRSVEELRGEWTINYTDIGGSLTKWCRFTVQYSDYFGKYRVIGHGHNWQYHPLYEHLSNKYIRINEKKHTEVIENKIKNILS